MQLPINYLILVLFMENSRRSALKQMSASILAGFIPLHSVTVSTSPRHFTGEDMYRGLFFAEGKFALLIPEMQSLKASHVSTQRITAQVSQITRTRQQIINDLKQNDPAFFTKFKAALLSQDILCVQRQLITASEQTTKTVERLYNSSAISGSSENYHLKKQSIASGQGMVLLIANAIACVNIIYILCTASLDELTSAGKSSPLLLEQISLSICNVAATVS